MDKTQISVEVNWGEGTEEQIARAQDFITEFVKVVTENAADFPAAVQSILIKRT